MDALASAVTYLTIELVEGMASKKDEKLKSYCFLETWPVSIARSENQN